MDGHVVAKLALPCNADKVAKICQALWDNEEDAFIKVYYQERMTGDDPTEDGIDGWLLLVAEDA